MDLVDEVVLASHRLAIINTTKSTELWRDRITAQIKSDPRTGIQGLRFKKSHTGGRAFVKPEMLMPQLRSGQARETRNRATQQKQQDMLLSTLTVEGVTSGSPDAVLFTMMNAASSKLGIKLNHSTSTNLLRPHGWAESRDANGVWDGRVLFMAESTAQLQTAFALLHGQGLEVEGMSYALEVENCHVDLDGTRVTNIRLPTTTEVASMGNGTGAQQAGPVHPQSARPAEPQ